jgi:putative nucleotidyltransferase with HDIG domain
LDDLVRRVEKLPASPAAVARLLSLAPGGAGKADGAAAPADLLDRMAAVVRCDPPLAARVMAMANRSAAGAATTVGAACRAVGVEGLWLAALTVGLLEPIPGVVPAGRMDYTGHWRHCLAVAHAARILAAEAFPQEDPELAYTAGLLHDIGKLLLLEIFPKTYARVLESVQAGKADIAQTERRLIGVDHGVAGRRLARHWRLGDAVEETAWLSHQPFEAIPDMLAHGGIVKVVALADVLVRETDLGFSGHLAMPRTSRQLAGPLGVSEDLLERTARQAGQLAQKDLSALGPSAGGQAAWRRAVRDVNLQLGKACEELAGRARCTQWQADAGARLQELFSTLSPKATVPEVLARLARVVANALAGRPGPDAPIVAYGLTGGRGAQAVRYDGSAEPAWARLDRDAAGTDELAWLSEWVDPAACRHRPILCGGRQVGGVVYPAPAGESAQRGIEALCQAVGPLLAVVQDRDAAMELGEQLAGATQKLVVTQEALAEAGAVIGIGEMASGAAHELNNPLAVISGRAQLLRDKTGDPDVRKTCQIIVEQAQRISDIITSLMEIASPAAPQAATVEVGALLAAAAKAFYSSDHPKAASAHVDIQCGQDAPPVRADEAQIRAALVEAMTNAATAAAEAPNIRLAAETDDADNAVILSVHDDGPGMDAETKARVFTPFFSAQRAGRRPGMGLPRARRYVEANGGRIWIDSKPGEGTTVYLRLPQA